MVESGGKQQLQTEANICCIIIFLKCNMMLLFIGLYLHIADGFRVYNFTSARRLNELQTRDKISALCPHISVFIEADLRLFYRLHIQNTKTVRRTVWKHTMYGHNYDSWHALSSIRQGFQSETTKSK